ncbi:MAG: hypothetical protein ACRCZZ_10995 [Phocaeicola sp.]
MSYTILRNKKVVKVDGKYMFLFEMASNNVTTVNPRTGREVLGFEWTMATLYGNQFLFDTAEAMNFLNNDVKGWEIAKAKRNFYQEGELTKQLTNAMFAKNCLTIESLLELNDFSITWSFEGDQQEVGNHFVRHVHTKDDLYEIQSLMRKGQLEVLGLGFSGGATFPKRQVTKKDTGFAICLGNGEYVKSLSSTRVHITYGIRYARLYQSTATAQKAMKRIVEARPWFEGKCSLVEIK